MQSAYVCPHYISYVKMNRRPIYFPFDWQYTACASAAHCCDWMEPEIRHNMHSEYSAELQERLLLHT
jgi:hypothetical protein